MSEQPRRECAELYCHDPPTTTIHGVEVCERHKAEIEQPWTTINDQQAEIDRLQRELERLQAERNKLSETANASAHVLLEHGVIPGRYDGECRCDECRHVAKAMAAAGYLDWIKNKWWEAAEAVKTEGEL